MTTRTLVSYTLKGLGHAILGIELHEISKQQLTSAEQLKANTAKPTRAMDGQNWIRLTRIALE